MAVKNEHRVGVQATAADVWAIVADIPGWPSWAPMYPAAAGRLRIGETLSFTVRLPDRPDQSLACTVVDWVPEHQIIWQTRLMGGLVTNTRYVEIVPLNADGPGVILANGEIYSGPMARFLPRKLLRDIYAGLATMNENAKARAEAAFRARTAQPEMVAP